LGFCFKKFIVAQARNNGLSPERLAFAPAEEHRRFVEAWDNSLRSQSFARVFTDKTFLMYAIA
jgi:hypothetical protein